jgi:hypothetical protein
MKTSQFFRGYYITIKTSQYFKGVCGGKMLIEKIKKYFIAPIYCAKRNFLSILSTISSLLNPDLNIFQNYEIKEHRRALFKSANSGQRSAYRKKYEK